MLNANCSVRSAQTGSPVVLVRISWLPMNSTMPQVSKPWRGSEKPGRAFSSPAKPPPGNWPYIAQHVGVVLVAGVVVGLRAGQRPVLGGLAEALREVDVVQAGDVVVPVRHVGVDLGDQVEQVAVAGSVVQPVDDVDRVAPAGRPPTVGEHVDGLRGDVGEVAGEEVVHAGVVVELRPGAQRVHHRHVRPEVDVAVGDGAQVVRPEVAVRRLGRQDRADPLLGAGPDARVAGEVAEVAVAAQPVGHLLPAVHARIDPAGLVEHQEVRSVLVAAVEAVDLMVELGGQPARRGHRTRRQAQEGRGLQRRQVDRVLRVRGCLGLRLVFGGRRQRGGRQGCRTRGEQGALEESASADGCHQLPPVLAAASRASRALAWVRQSLTFGLAPDQRSPNWLKLSRSADHSVFAWAARKFR